MQVVLLLNFKYWKINFLVAGIIFLAVTIAAQQNDNLVLMICGSQARK
jgi:hypothetical protein